MALYLRKYDDSVVSHCKCAPEKALVAWPGQADCPWCGCGYLWSCTHCRSAFTFAVAVEIPGFQMEEFVRGDLVRFGYEPKRLQQVQIQQIAGYLAGLVRDLVPGSVYAYLDGCAVWREQNGVRVNGKYGVHALAEIPHRGDVASMVRRLDQGYWQKARREKKLRTIQS